MTCKKCGTTLNAINKCYDCGDGDQDVKVESPTHRGRKKPIIKIGVAIALNIITIIISLAAIFWSHTLPNTTILMYELKIFAWITIIFAVFNLAAAIFIPKLKEWKFFIYFAFTVLNFTVSSTIFVISQFRSGMAASAIYQTFLSLLK